MRILFFAWTLLLTLACAKDGDNNQSSHANVKTYRYLALGDSYTIGTAIGEKKAYPVLLVDSLDSQISDSIEYEVIARNGWTTADLQNGINSAEPDSSFDVVTILIGVNNQYQGLSISEYQGEFLKLLNQAISFAQGEKERVLVISIPDWGVSPAGAANRMQIAAEINDFNFAQKQVCDSLEVDFIDITSLSRTGVSNSAYIASDGLHFSAKMHQLWMRALYPMWNQKIRDE